MIVVKDIIERILYMNRLPALIRIVIGALFIYSGFFKSLDITAFGRVIALYNILPDILIPYAAIFFPFLEIVLGILLIAGFRIKPASLVSIAMMIVFAIAITVNVIRGESFDCGCFELKRLGIDENVSVRLIFRDLFLILLLFIVFKAKRHSLSVDSLIEKFGLRDI